MRSMALIGQNRQQFPRITQSFTYRRRNEEANIHSASSGYWRRPQLLSGVSRAVVRTQISWARRFFIILDRNNSTPSRYSFSLSPSLSTNYHFVHFVCLLTLSTSFLQIQNPINLYHSTFCHFILSGLSTSWVFICFRSAFMFGHMWYFYLCSFKMTWH